MEAGRLGARSPRTGVFGVRGRHNDKNQHCGNEHESTYNQNKLSPMLFSLGMHLLLIGERVHAAESQEHALDEQRRGAFVEEREKEKHRRR